MNKKVFVLLTVIVSMYFMPVYAQDKHLLATIGSWIPPEFNSNRDMLIIWKVGGLGGSQKKAEDYVEKNYHGQYMFSKGAWKIRNYDTTCAEPSVAHRYELRYDIASLQSIETGRTVSAHVVYFFYDCELNKAFSIIPSSHGVPAKIIEDLVDVFNDYFKAK